jgi:hypothetical protein
MKITSHLKYCHSVGREVLWLVGYVSTNKRFRGTTASIFRVEAVSSRFLGNAGTEFLLPPDRALLSRRSYRSLDSSDTIPSLERSPAIKETTSTYRTAQRHVQEDTAIRTSNYKRFKGRG